MKEYHILYFEEGETTFCKGMNIKAMDMVEAVKSFKREKGIEPFCVYSKEVEIIKIST